MRDERESRTERRRGLRADIEAPATYMWPGGAEAIAGSGTATTLSDFGVRIDHATHKVKLGDRLELRFSLFLGSHAAVFRGRVAWEKDDSFAIEFVDLEPHHRRVLEAAMGQR